MSKAILVIDMPSGCIKCPLYDYVPSSCFLTNKFQNNISDDFKPDWCPLKPIPDMKSDDGFFGTIMNEWYNACIDEILRGSEENG